ncbi:MAG: hypothetical protein QM718_14140 [Steroidobacteraceae bacterium]
MSAELEHVRGNVHALVWAIGCVWASYLERYGNRTRPILITFLIAVAAILGWRYLLAATGVWLAFLGWFGVSLNSLPILSGYWFVPLRILLCVVFVALAAAATPGNWHRRLLGALAFPFLAFACLPVSALGGDLATLILPWLPHHPPFLLGITFGAMSLVMGGTISLLLSLPFTLVYRSSAALIASVALLPEIGLVIAPLSHSTLHRHLLLRSIYDFGPFVCAGLGLLMLTALWNRWLPPPHNRSAVAGRSA